MARRAAFPDTLLAFPFAAAIALLGPLAGVVPRGMPVWAITMLVLSAALLARTGGLARLLRPDRWAAASVLAFLALAGASVAWSPSPRAGLTFVEIGYIALAAALAGACIADLPEEAAGRLGRLFVGGLMVGILIFSVENALDYPLHRWVNHTPADVPVSIGNVPKRAAALLALLVWPAALVVRRLGYRLLAPALPLGFAALSLLQSSRSAIAGVAIGLVAFALASWWATATRRALAGALAAAFAGAIPLAYLLERVLDLDHAPWLFTSARHRVEIWWRAANRALETPLLGQGIDAARALKPMGETSQFETLAESLLPLHPHNAFIQVWLELGGLGAALALAVTLMVLGGTRRLERADQPYALASFMAALGMVSTAYGIWQAWWMAGMLAAGLMVLLASRVPRRER
ncbi:O-antigen ligase family protein [Azospirillum sp. sgz301742]